MLMHEPFTHSHCSLLGACMHALIDHMHAVASWFVVTASELLLLDHELANVGLQQTDGNNVEDTQIGM